MMCSGLTQLTGNNHAMGDVEYGKICNMYFPPAELSLLDGPSCSVFDMCRILGHGTTDGGLVVGTFIMLKLGLQLKPFTEACYGFWHGVDCIQHDVPQVKMCPKTNQLLHLNTHRYVIVPAPRSNHTVCLHECWVVLFGGHGGIGYEHHAFNDTWALNF